MFRKLGKALEPDFIEYRGLRLPPRSMRLGSMPEKTDETYVNYASGSAKLLENWVNANSSSKILDVGCGPGRLLIGALSRWGAVGGYCGLDVSAESIKWASEFLTEGEGTTFIKLDVLSERYNPGGALIGGDFNFPVPPDSFDVAALFSVFSHMLLKDISVYLGALHKVLTVDGQIFCTLFVEDDVPDEQENPPDYLADWSGPVHCIRINRRVFEHLCQQQGWRVEKFKHRAMASGQSIYALAKQI